MGLRGWLALLIGGASARPKPLSSVLAQPLGGNPGGVHGSAIGMGHPNRRPPNPSVGPCAVRRGRGRGPPMRGARDPIAPVLLDDDGELDEVRRVLVSLGIEYAEAGAGAPRARVIVSNGRRRDAEARVGPDAGLRRFHVAVVEKLTRMQRR